MSKPRNEAITRRIEGESRQLSAFGLQQMPEVKPQMFHACKMSYMNSKEDVATAFTDRVALIRKAYVAFNGRDVDAVLDMLDPEVDWPNLLDGVVAHGHDAVRAYWLRQFGMFSAHVEPTDFIPHGEAIVVAVHQVVRDLDGNVLRETDVAHVYRFAGDLVKSMVVYPSVDEALRSESI